MIGSVGPFIQVRRIVGLGVPILIGTKAQVLAGFKGSNDAPVLFRHGHFFLLHAPSGIIAGYRKCTHLGHAVPFGVAEDSLPCPCHGAIFDQRTTIVIRDLAPKSPQLFHVSETDVSLAVDTNPLIAIDRPRNRWDPPHRDHGCRGPGSRHRHGAAAGALAS